MQSNGKAVYRRTLFETTRHQQTSQNFSLSSDCLFTVLYNNCRSAEFNLIKSKRKGMISIVFFFHCIVSIMHIYWILLFAYRDNGRISFASSTAEEFFANYNYDCVGIEAIIRECPYNYKSCPSSPTSGTSKRTNLNCTGKIDFVLDTCQFIYFFKIF